MNVSSVLKRLATVAAAVAALAAGNAARVRAEGQGAVYNVVPRIAWSLSESRSGLRRPPRQEPGGLLL